jgi:RIO kinase 1
MNELDRLLADGIIDEICGRLKSGKEADITAVRRGDVILAAKVYKDRATRSFKNNADYKEGRKVRNTRTQRAIDSGGKFGRESEEQAWKSAEADALHKLVGSGVRVPAPVMFYEGVLLMELVAGADGQVAPRLIDVAIQPADALGIYADLVAQMISMLCADLIHGDLSPYNILLGAEGPTIIDFPQVVSAAHSTRAEFFFLRDFDNVLRFLVSVDPTLAVHRADGRAIWRAYVGRELTPQFVPPPPAPPRREERRFDRGPRPQGRDGRPSENRGPQGRDRRPLENRGRRPQGQPPREGRPPENRGPQGRDGRSWENRGPQGRDGRPAENRGLQGRNGSPQEDRGPPARDGRPPENRGSQGRDGRPPENRGSRSDAGPRVREWSGNRETSGAPESGNRETPREPWSGNRDAPRQPGDREGPRPRSDDQRDRRNGPPNGNRPPEGRRNGPPNGNRPPGDHRNGSPDGNRPPDGRWSASSAAPPRNDRPSDRAPRTDRPARAAPPPRPRDPSGGHRRRPKRRW